MDELPADLLAAIPPTALDVARGWWDSLSENDRAQVVDLWDQRREVHFFTPQADESGLTDRWDEVPSVRGGRFVPHDDAWGLAEWGPGYFEHLLQHPELVLLWAPAERIFHIGCSVHAAARSCLESGVVPVDFSCPIGSPSCPLLPLAGARLTSRCSGPGPPRGESCYHHAAVSAGRSAELGRSAARFSYGERPSKNCSSRPRRLPCGIRRQDRGWAAVFLTTPFVRRRGWLRLRAGVHRDSICSTKPAFY